MNRSAIARTGAILLLCAAAASGQTPKDNTAGQVTVAGPRPLPSLKPSVQLTVPEAPNGGTVVKPGTKLSVAEAVRIALANHPDIALSAASVQSSAGALRQQKSGLGPSLTLSATEQHSRTMRISGSSANVAGETGSASVEVSQLVYDFGRTNGSVNAARQDLKAAKYALDGTRIQVVLAAKQGFYGYVQARRLTAVAEQQLHDQQQHLDEAQARYQAGDAAWGDVPRALASVASAQASLTSAQRDELEARMTLAEAMGVDPRTVVDVGEQPEAAADVKPDALVDQALRNRPEMAQARANLEAAKVRLSVSRLAQAPQISAFGGMSASNSSFSDSASGQAYVGISLTATPFDSGLTRGKIEQSRAAVASAEASLRSTQQSVTQSVLAAHLDLQTAIQQAASAEAQVASAEESLRVAEGRYRAGEGTLLDVTDAQTTANEARVSLVNARAKISLSAAALAYQLGQPASGAAADVKASTGPKTK